MSVILSNAIESHITHEVTYASSKILNEFENGISKASHIAIPSIVKQITNQSADSDLLNKVYELVDQISSKSDTILNNLSEVLVENGPIKKLGITLLDTIFDKNSNTVSTEMASESFIKVDSANQILIMSAVLILAHISKKQISKSEIINIQETPVPIIEKKEINLDNFETLETHEFLKVETKKEMVKKPNDSTIKPVANSKNATTESKSFFEKNSILLIIISIIAVFGILFFFVASSRESQVITEAPKKAMPTVKVETQPQIITAADITQLGDFIDFTLPNDAILHVPEKGFEKGLLDMVLNNSNSLDESNWWLNFDNVYFEARDTKFKIDSEEQIKNLAQIMNSFPKVKIKIGCYTDNLGDKQSNLLLSEARAQSLRSALIVLGVQASRLTAEGFGDQFSISSNDTETGRAENRRIAVKIIEK